MLQRVKRLAGKVSDRAGPAKDSLQPTKPSDEESERTRALLGAAMGPDAASAKLRLLKRFDPTATIALAMVRLAADENGGAEETLRSAAIDVLKDGQESHLLWELFSAGRGLGYSDGAFHLMETMASHPTATTRILHEYAHQLRRRRRNGDALVVYDQIINAFPNRIATRFERGRVLLEEGRADKALEDFEAVAPLMPRHASLRYERGRALVALKRVEEAEKDFRQALTLAPPDPRACLRLSDIFMQRGDREAALGTLSEAVSIKPRDAELRMKRARLLSEMGNWSAALRDAESARRNSGGSQQTERFYNDVRARMALEVGSTREVLVILPPDGSQLKPDALFDIEATEIFSIAGVVAPSRKKRRGQLWIEGEEQECGDTSLTGLVAQTGADAVLYLESEQGLDGLTQTLDALAKALTATVAISCKSFEEKGHVDTLMVDVGFLNMFLVRPSQADAPADPISVRESLQLVADYCTVRSLDGSCKLRPVQVQDGEAWLVSNSGIKAFGGVEHFLRIMHRAYGRSGIDGVIVGLTGEDGDSGDLHGIPYFNTSREAGVLLDQLLERRPQIVHGTTGVGYELLALTRFLRCSFVYGTHFWRDMFHGEGWFPDIDKYQTPIEDFAQLAALSEHPYSNSFFTADLTHRHFKHAQDIIFSLPAELTQDDLIARAKDASAREGGYALLLNARPEKGLDMVLAAAPLVPEVEFVCVASQSGIETTKRLVEERGLTNVRVIEKVDNADELYRNARVVLVPSFSFVETFSRVVIEAHRHGLPVIGSDRGNVPLLLEFAGVALPEESSLWADEIRRLYQDDAYYQKRSRRALENAGRYSASLSEDAVDRIVRAHRNRIAVAVGSGIGNVVQTLPALMRLAKHFKAPVDVLVSSDFDQSVCTLLHHPAIANAFVYDALSASRAYDLVIVLDCFGRLPPTNYARRVVNTRDYTAFGLMRTMSESEFNLLGMKRALGIEYESSDIDDLDMRFAFASPRSKRCIGVHGGSKKDIYAAKQWPFFPELVEHLKGKGYEVHSFGVPDEYVEGCVDRTGTPLIDSIRNMSTCSAFISNDSGLMHIADALHIPLVSMFAPTSVVKNGPFSGESHVVKVDKPCSPCQFDGQAFARCKCIREISIASVVAKLRDIGLEV